MESMTEADIAYNATPWHKDDHYRQLEGSGVTAVTASMPRRRTTTHGGTMWLPPSSRRHRIHDHHRTHDVSMFKPITGYARRESVCIFDC